MIGKLLRRKVKDYEPKLPEDAECSICKEQFNSAEALTIQLPQCKHTFDEECIIPWLKVNSTCPVNQKR